MPNKEVLIMQKLSTILILSCVLGMPTMSFAHRDKPHGSHDAMYGGLVMMYADLHFEVVLEEEGGVKLYYSDASRAELPAAVVSKVQVEILRDDSEAETVVMNISEAGDYWGGVSTAVSKLKTIVRVAFIFQDEALVFELPAHMFPSIMEQKRTARAAHKA
ncbi:MAG: hypothetical protein RQ899_09435 [Pseudomonadales bacterium]|nr:hypothetical protein [Pseudomonadales bacterium]